MSQKAKLENKKLKIIVDTNALFVPLKFNIDIFENLKGLLNRNFELLLLSTVREELERLRDRGSPETQRKVSYALTLANKCTPLDVERKSSTDDSIVQVAMKHRYIVFTNDTLLRNRLRDINVPVIYVRHKSRLEIDGRI